MIVPLQPAHASSLATIHCAGLANDFLPRLGVGFLTVFYQGVLERKVGFGFADVENDRIVGFVLGCADAPAMFKVLLGSGYALRLGLQALPAVLRRPGLLLSVLETFLYPQKEAPLPGKAELVVIALEQAQRRRGRGRGLVRALNDAFIARGIAAYKVSVLQTKEDANRFYLALGFVKAGEFVLYRKRWNLYRYSLVDSR